jgi:hypothetical protein
LQQEKQMHCQRQIDDHDSDVGFFLGVWLAGETKVVKSVPAKLPLLSNSLIKIFLRLHKPSHAFARLLKWKIECDGGSGCESSLASFHSLSKWAPRLNNWLINSKFQWRWWRNACEVKTPSYPPLEKNFLDSVQYESLIEP